MNPRIKRLLSMLLALTMMFSFVVPVAAAGTADNTVEIEVGESVKLGSSGWFTRTTWTSSDETVATVSANGTVTGVAVGTATVTATSKSIFSFFGGSTTTTTYTVVVTEGTAEVPTEPEETQPEETEPEVGLTVKAGETLQLTVDADGGTTEWSSSDENVATVDENGLVTGVSEGEVTITATVTKTTGNGFWFFWWGSKTTTTKTEFEVTVLPGEPEVVYYTVTFECGGGSAVEAQVVEEGMTASEPEAPTMEGYTFAGWYTDAELTAAYDFATPVTADITLYAAWEEVIVYYTVTFETNGGSAVEAQTVAEGECASEPEAPTMEGYTFAGWYTDAELTEAYDFTTPVTADVTLYAAWEVAIVTYTVNFETNGGSEIAPQVIEEGGFVEQPADPQREGYRLLAWYEDEDLTTVYDFESPVTANLTLYAAWEEIVEEEDSFLDQDPVDVEIYTFDADRNSIVVGETVTVHFEAEIFAETALGAEEVVLYQDDEAFGVMYDDGTNGDTTAGDGIYVYEVALSSDTECTRSYQVKVRDAASEIRTIGFYVPMTDEELDGIQTVDNALAELMSSDEFAALTTEEMAAEVVELLTALADEGLVVADSIYYDEVDQAVYYEYATGALGVVMLGQNNEWNANGTGEKSADGTSVLAGLTYSAEASVLNSSYENEKKVLVLNGFEAEAWRRDYYNELETEWDALGLNTTVDINVTVADMKVLDGNNWDVVVFAMHGTKYRVVRGADKQPVLCVNEVPTSTTDSAYTYELNQVHTVIKVRYKDGTTGYLITPQFFTDNYAAQDLDGMMFFSETCMFYGCDCQSTTPDYTLANAITGRSAEVVVGYHNSVEAHYSRDVMKIVIEESFNGATVRAAVNTAKSSEGEDDNWTDASDDKYDAYPEIAGNGSFILRPDGMVKGTVKDASSGSAISNALIRVYNENNRQVASARSDASGAYTLNLEAGSYILEVSAGSYKKVRSAIEVNAEGTTYLENFLMVSNTFTFGTVSGIISNSITDQPVSDVTVLIRKGWNNYTGGAVTTTTTNANGYYEMDGLSAGTYTISYFKAGFATGRKNITVLTGANHNLLISPVTSEGVFRIVLSWGADPRDLDSHVVGTLSDASSFHVYYASKSGYDGDLEVCNLDIDDTSGYGPETITLNPSTNEPYYYYIYHYSGDGSISTSGAQVKVYKGSDLVKTYYAPEDQGTGRYWNVFAIVNEKIVEHNTISSGAETDYAVAEYNALKLTQTSVVSGVPGGYSEFKNLMEDDFLVPGLSESDRMVPQGICVSQETGLTYISAYHKDGDGKSKKASVVMVLDQSGALVAEYHLYNGDNSAMKGHVGGIAVTDTTLFIAWDNVDDLHYQIAAVPLATLTTSGSQKVKLTTSYRTPVTPSFISYHDGILWIGNFYSPDDGYEASYQMPAVTYGDTSYGSFIVGYDLSEEGNARLEASSGYATPDHILAAPNRVQGMVYDRDSGTVVLSLSYKRNGETAELRYYDYGALPSGGEMEINGTDMSYRVLTGATKTVDCLPMNEGLALDQNGHLLVVFESAADYYRNGRNGGSLAKDPTDCLWRSKDAL